MTKVLSKRLGVMMACLAGVAACAHGGDGTQIGPAPEVCFSPEQTPELAIDRPGAGCACDGNDGQCVATTYQGRAWDVALVCSGGRWTSVEDGPCAPSMPIPESCPEGTRAGSSCTACGPTDACTAGETTCLTVCDGDEDCPDPQHGACLGGLCRNACG